MNNESEIFIKIIYRRNQVGRRVIIITFLLFYFRDSATNIQKGFAWTKTTYCYFKNEV